MQNVKCDFYIDINQDMLNSKDICRIQKLCLLLHIMKVHQKVHCKLHRKVD